MRSEVERAFQAGGGVTDEMIEEDLGVWVGDVPDAGGLAQATEPPPEPEPEAMELPTTRIDASDPGIAGLREMATLDLNDALARLRAGQEAITERRAKREKEDERARWLALAQGMLAPTRTGAFGESLGTSAGLLREEQQRRRRGEDELIEMEMALADQESALRQGYIKTMAGLEGTETALRPETVGTENLVPHPDNPDQFAYVQQYTDPNTGESTFKFIEAVDPETGERYIPRAIDRMDAQIRAGIVAGEEAARGRLDRANADIELGRMAFTKIGQFNEALTLLDQLEAQGGSTGGVQALMLKFANLFGVNDPTVTTMGALNRYLGEQVLEGLQNFKGQLSNLELGYMRDLESAIEKGTDINRALLERGIRIMRGRHRRGIAAATSMTDYGGFLGSPSDFAALGIDDIDMYMRNPQAYEQTFGETGQMQAVGAGGIPIGERGSTEDNPIILHQGMSEEDRPPKDAYVQAPGGQVFQMN